MWPSRLQSEEEKCRDHGLAGHPFICTGVQSIQEAPVSRAGSFADLVPISLLIDLVLKLISISNALVSHP